MSSYFEKFSEEQIDLLASLPFRVGLWVSESDSTGGHQADESEKKALENIIAGFSEDFCKSEFVDALMRETVNRRQSWKNWEKKMDAVPEDCRRAVDMLAARMEKREVTFFKHNLMDIAMTVAMAYCEFNDFDTPQGKMKAYGRYFLHRLKAFVTRRQPLSMTEIVNISHEERLALSALGQALRPDVKEGLEPADDAEAA